MATERDSSADEAAPTPPKRLIWFCSTEHVAEQPDVLKKLRDAIGLTTIMPESHICHTSGFRASEEIEARGPFEDWRSRTELWPKAEQGIYPPVAGTVGGFDDTPLLRVIEMAREAGIEIWGHLGLWCYGGNVFPEYAMEDVEGRPLDMRYLRWGIGLCPSRRSINDWTRDCLVDVVGRYDVDGFCVDHARYPMPANLSSLAGCGCGSCQEAAEELGYDFPRMAEALLALRNRIRNLSRADVVRLADCPLGFWDLVAYLGEDAAILDWFRFRAALLADRMGGFRQAVRAASGDETVFGSDVFAPSIALLGGHDYPAWAKGADYLTGGSSAGGVVGWATAVTSVATEWAPALCRTVSGLQEAEALRLVYRLFGYHDLDLPLTVQEIQDGPLPLETIYAREVAKLRTLSGRSLPLYPPVSAQGGPERVRELCRAVVDNGCDGAMLGLNPDNHEILEVIRENFR